MTKPRKVDFTSFQFVNSLGSTKEFRIHPPGPLEPDKLNEFREFVAGHADDLRQGMIYQAHRIVAKFISLHALFAL